MTRASPALALLAGISLVVVAVSCRPPPAPQKEASVKPRAEEPAKRPAPARERQGSFRAEPVRPELALDEATQHKVIEAARAACEGSDVDQSLDAIEAPVLLIAYSEEGKRVGEVRRERGPLGANVLAAGRELCRSAAAKKGFLHALVVTYTARLPNFGIKGPFDNRLFEPQVTGIAYELGEKRVELDPLKQLERNMGPKMVRSFLARELRFPAARLPSQRDLTVEIYRAEHVGERYPDRKPQRYFRGHAELDVADVDAALLRKRLELIGDWYRNNVKDGQVTYDYSPTARRYRDDRRTMVRSTMSTWILNRLARYLDDEELSDKGAEVIDYYQKRYFRMDESKAAGRLLPSPEPLKNGNLVEDRWTTASFLAAAMNEREDRERYREDMPLLMDWAMSHLDDDGVYDIQFGQSQYFMPGQVLLAVAYFYRDTDDPARKERYRAHFDKAFDTYAPVLQQMMHLGPKWHVPYAPAWFTQPAAQMYLVTGEDKYKDLVFAINDRVLHHYDINARYQVYPDYDGMLAPKPNSYGNNSITSASLEALVDAAIVAKRAGDVERLARYREVIRRATAFLLRLQWTPENTYYLQERERVMGGFKRDMLDTTSWMDSVWHLTSAFIKIQKHELL